MPIIIAVALSLLPALSAAAIATIPVGYVGHDHQLALYVAAREGQAFIDTYGVGLRPLKEHEVYELVDGGTALARLRLIKVGGGSNMPAAMERGDIAIGFGGTMAVAKFIDKGQPFKIIAPLQTDGDMLVMARGSPVRDWAGFVKAAKSGERPLTIGYKAPTAIAKLVFERALVAEGISYSTDRSRSGEVQVVLINFGSEKGPLPLLAAEAIDGFVMNQPVPAVVEAKGLGRIVAQLRDLPPAGKWHDHPCCCVAAHRAVIDEQPAAVQALLASLILATDLIHRDRERAIDHATAWLRNPRAIEATSVPTVTYVVEPTPTWLAGMRTWSRMLDEIGTFRGSLAGKKDREFLAAVCDFELLDKAMAALGNAGHRAP